MKSNKLNLVAILGIITIIVATVACKKSKLSILKGIHQKDVNATIDECNVDGKKVYHFIPACIAMDCPTEIYDEDGKLLGTCGMTNSPICSQLKDCKTIFSLGKAIGDGIDIYGINK